MANLPSPPKPEKVVSQFTVFFHVTFFGIIMRIRYITVFCRDLSFRMIFLKKVVQENAGR